MKTTKSALVAGALGLSVAGGAFAETYRASTWLPESEGTTVVLRIFADEVAAATDGAIEFEVFSGAALMPPKAHLTGIGDGIAQWGFHTSGYTPSDLPIANALAGFGFVQPEPVIIAAAWTDYLMNDPAQNGEFRAHGVVPVGAFSTPTYPIICNTSEPITELDQMQGLKVRSLNMLGDLVQHLGGVAVNIPATEIYQALQTGQLDCAGIFAAWLNIDNKLDEVSNSITMMNWSGSFNSPMALYNDDFWQGLSTEQRDTILKLSAKAQAKLQLMYYTNQAKALELAGAKDGFSIHEPSDSITTAVNAWVEGGVGDMAGIAKNTYGIEDPQALFDSFRPYITKWEGIIGGMNDPMDEAEMAQVLYDEIYGKIDPATYGMN